MEDDITIFLPSTCVPITTEVSNGTLLNADQFGPPLIGPPLEGVPSSCETVATSVTTGLVMNGQIAFYDSTIGDLQTLVTTTLK